MKKKKQLGFFCPGNCKDVYVPWVWVESPLHLRIRHAVNLQAILTQGRAEGLEGTLQLRPFFKM